MALIIGCSFVSLNGMSYTCYLLVACIVANNFFKKVSWLVKLQLACKLQFQASSKLVQNQNMVQTRLLGQVLMLPLNLSVSFSTIIHMSYLVWCIQSCHTFPRTGHFSWTSHPHSSLSVFSQLPLLLSDPLPIACGFSLFCSM